MTYYELIRLWRPICWVVDVESRIIRWLFSSLVWKKLTVNWNERCCSVQFKCFNSVFYIDIQCLFWAHTDNSFSTPLSCLRLQGRFVSGASSSLPTWSWTLDRTYLATIWVPDGPELGSCVGRIWACGTCMVYLEPGVDQSVTMSLRDGDCCHVWFMKQVICLTHPSCHAGW